jgi:hypothetical protein
VSNNNQFESEKKKAELNGSLFDHQWQQTKPVIFFTQPYHKQHENQFQHVSCMHEKPD